MSDSTDKYGVTISSNNSTFMVLSLTALVTTPVLPWYQTLSIMWVSYVDSKKVMICSIGTFFEQKYLLPSQDFGKGIYSFRYF